MIPVLSDDTSMMAKVPQQFESGPLADLAERKVIFAALDSFSQYRANAHYNTTHRRRQNFYALPKHQREILSQPPFDLLDTFVTVDDAIDCNADLADAILLLGLQSFGLQDHPIKGSQLDWKGHAKPSDMLKAHSTIRQFYRDWTSTGFKTETEPLLKIVQQDLAVSAVLPEASQRPSILLPGAGLGRLLFELCLAGYNVEGNEISYHQLLASNFILNATQYAERFKIYPFINTFTNNLQRVDQLQEFRIPDVHPGTCMIRARNDTAQDTTGAGEMNMSAGDFVTSYNGEQDQSAYDAVVTVYFIDTAPNVFRYIETIFHCLREGGLWINIGPLLWHFDNRQSSSDSDEQKKTGGSQPDTEDWGIGEPGSFELSNDELMMLIQQSGFEIIVQEILPEGLGAYIENPRSMVQNRYRCNHWVARKVARE